MTAIKNQIRISYPKASRYAGYQVSGLVRTQVAGLFDEMAHEVYERLVRYFETQLEALTYEPAPKRRINGTEYGEEIFDRIVDEIQDMVIVQELHEVEFNSFHRLMAKHFAFKL